MGLLYENCYIDILSIIIALFCTFIAYFKYKYTYWSRKGVEFIPPEIPYGNSKPLLLQKMSAGEFMRDLYVHFKAKEVPLAGFYTFSVPQAILIDAELIKNILTRDFSYFADRGFLADEENEPLTGNLLALSGSKWKHMRQILTPTFTSGKMKMMFQTMVACADGLEDIISEHVKKNEVIEIKDILGRFTTDVIGSCAFGLDCNSIKDTNSDFRKYGRKQFSPNASLAIKRILAKIFPKLITTFKLRQIDTEVSDFFMNIVKETVEYREKNKVQRNDFLQLLINIKNTGDVDGKKGNSLKTNGLNIGEIAAQSFLFFLAGFETSSTTMYFFLYEMAQNQDIQDKVREEIHNMLKKYDGKITYEGIMEMQYLDMALSESMRLHPGVPNNQRLCTKDYKIPDSDLIIEKGTFVNISILGLHHDPEYYPNPLKYDPQRFRPEEKEKRPSVSFSPFGDGPRVCIGQRFGLLQTKVGLITLLKNHKYTLNSKTMIPYKLEPKSMLYNTVGGMYLNAERV